jgi:hypothetical protein
MNRSQSKIRHIQEANILLEKRLLNEQATPNTWLSYPNDKNYQYQKQGDKWMGKNVKTGKVIDLAKYPTTIQKLETQFPGGKAPAGTTPEGGTTPGALTSSTNNNVSTVTTNQGSTPTNNQVSTATNNQVVGATNNDGKKVENSTPEDLKNLKTTIKAGTYARGEMSDEAEKRRIYIRNVIKLKDCNLYEIAFNQVGKSGQIVQGTLYMYSEQIGTSFNGQYLNGGARCGKPQSGDKSPKANTSQCIPCNGWKDTSIRTNAGEWTVYSKLVPVM